MGECTKQVSLFPNFDPLIHYQVAVHLHKELDGNHLFSSSFTSTSVCTTSLFFITFSSSPQLEELALWPVIVVGGTHPTQSAHMFEWDQEKHRQELD